MAILAILVLFTAALELKAPYYFLQDDNRDYTLPLWLGSARALAQGELGQINFYQSLGMPLFASGQSGGMTPFSYLSIAASQALLGHPFAAIEIAVFLSFAIGGLGFLYLARILELSPAAGLFAALAWCLSPFNVYVAIAWVLIAPLVAFLPWIVGLALSLYRQPRAGTLAALAAVHALLFFSGYVPWLMFLAVFEAGLLAVLAAADLRRPEGRASLRRAAIAFGLLPLLFLSLAAPLLLPMAHQTTRSALRSQSMEYYDFSSQAVRPWVWLNGLLFPVRRLYEFDRETPNGFLEFASPPAITHVGYLTLAFAAVGVAWTLRRRQPGSRAVWLAFLLLAALALVWAFGWLSPVLYRVPFFNRLRWPFRLLPFANFFLVCLAAGGFEWSRRWGARGARAVVAAVLAVHALNLAAVNLGHSQRGFFEHLDPIPLGAPPWIGPHEGRVFSYGLITPMGQKAYTAETLAFDYAMLWRIFHFAGYETMMPQANAAATLFLNHASPAPTASTFVGTLKELPLDYLREWGVGWHVVTAQSHSFYGKALAAAGLELAHTGRHTFVYRDDRAKPLVFWADTGSAEALELDVGPNTLTVGAEAEAPGAITLSFLFSSFYQATLDGRPVDLTHNSIGQMVVGVPAGRHTVQLRYADPYLRVGLLLSALGISLFAAALVVFRRRLRRRA